MNGSSIINNHFCRFPFGKGIAGYVAETGETLNVVDASKDERFNPSIDELTGYKTKYEHDETIIENETMFLDLCCVCQSVSEELSLELFR